MAKLTDSQNVIISRTLARAARNGRHILVSHKASGLSCDLKGYKAAVNGLIKRNIVESVPGLQRVENGDYDHEGCIYSLTESFLNEESPEKAKKGKVAINIAVDVVAPVPTPKEVKKKAIETPKVDANDLDDAEEDEEAGPKGSVVPDEYRSKYRTLKQEGGTGQDCNDELAKFMTATFISENTVNGRRERNLDVFALMEFANENGVESDRLPFVNNGQKRMIIGNVLRKKLRKGQDVIWYGRKVVKGMVVEVKTEA
jgi:hypothetical protein